MDWAAVIGVGVVILVGGSVIALVWWRIADRWADDEHKRFRGKADGRERVVMRGFEKSGVQGGGESGGEGR